MESLKQQFNKTIMKDLQKKTGIKNVMAVPHLTKIVVNMGVKGAVGDKKSMEVMAGIMGQITGQKPKVTRAKKAIASFKLRQGDPIGLVATMRGGRMYTYFDKLVKVVLPRIKDFRGVPRGSFDGHGNYTLGFSEYSVFPEIDPGSVDRLQGFEIVMVTTAVNDKDAFALLESMGMPFAKEQKK